MDMASAAVQRPRQRWRRLTFHLLILEAPSGLAVLAQQLLQPLLVNLARVLGVKDLR